MKGEKNVTFEQINQFRRRNFCLVIHWMTNLEWILEKKTSSKNINKNNIMVTWLSLSIYHVNIKYIKHLYWISVVKIYQKSMFCLLQTTSSAHKIIIICGKWNMKLIRQLNNSFDRPTWFASLHQGTVSPSYLVRRNASSVPRLKQECWPVIQSQTHHIVGTWLDC